MPGKERLTKKKQLDTMTNEKPLDTTRLRPEHMSLTQSMMILNLHYVDKFFDETTMMISVDADYYAEEMKMMSIMVGCRYNNYVNPHRMIIQASPSTVIPIASGPLRDQLDVDNDHDYTLTVATESEPDKVVSSFKVHRSVLASKSNYFKTLFASTGFLESSTNSSKVVLSDDQVPFVQAFLNFCYGKPLEIDQTSIVDFDMVKALQNFADRYLVDDLVKEIGNFWQKVKRLGSKSYEELKKLQKFKIDEKLSILPHPIQAEIITFLGPMKTGSKSYKELRSFKRGCPPALMIFSAYTWLAEMDVDEIKEKLSILPPRIQAEILFFLGPMDEFIKRKTAEMREQESIGPENKKRKT